MDLARYAMTCLGEQIHIAAWPAISAIAHNPHSEIFDNVSESAARHHALSSQSFVVNVQSRVGESAVKKMGFEDDPDMFHEGGGWSAIVGPEGRILAGPNTDDEEILYADIDLSDIIMSNYAVDSVGHYARPDILRLLMDRSEQPVYEERDLSGSQSVAANASEDETEMAEQQEASDQE